MLTPGHLCSYARYTLDIRHAIVHFHNRVVPDREGGMKYGPEKASQKRRDLFVGVQIRLSRGQLASLSHSWLRLSASLKTAQLAGSRVLALRLQILQSLSSKFRYANVAVSDHLRT